jgi:hypothetical protein
MRILRLKRGNHQIVYETLQIGKSYGKLVVLVRDIFKLRMEVGTKSNLKTQNSWISITKVEKTCPYALHFRPYT